MVTVFLSSCEKNAGQNEPAINNLETDESSTVYFKLPESFDNISPTDFESYMADKEENHISELAKEILQSELELRWCGSPKYIGSHCSGSCPHGSLRGKVKFYRKYCDDSGWIWYSVNTSDCCW